MMFITLKTALMKLNGFLRSLVMGNDLDVYFDDNYGKLYEKVENGKAEIFNFNYKFGIIKNQFIKREIPIRINNEIYYDIVTPYGYGGPVIIKCEENKIVSEFIRFHPILENAEDFTSVYDVKCIRKTLGTNLKDFEDPFQIE